MARLCLHGFRAFAKYSKAAVLSAVLVALPAARASALPLSAPSALPAAGLPDFSTLVEKVGPALVNIRTTGRVQLMQGNPFLLPPGFADVHEFSVLLRRSRLSARAASAPDLFCPPMAM